MFGNFTRIFVFIKVVSCHSFFQVLKIVKIFPDNCSPNNSNFILKEAPSLHKFVNSLLLPYNFKFKLLRWSVGFCRPSSAPIDQNAKSFSRSLFKDIGNSLISIKNSKILEQNWYFNVTYKCKNCIIFNSK